MNSSEESIHSDVHEEYRELKASRNHFNRSNRGSRGITIQQVHTGEKVPNIGYDEKNVGSKDNLLGKLEVMSLTIQVMKLLALN